MAKEDDILYIDVEEVLGNSGSVEINSAEPRTKGNHPVSNKTNNKISELKLSKSNTPHFDLDELQKKLKH